MAKQEKLMTGPFLWASAANFLQGMALHSYLHLPGFLEGMGASALVIGLIFGAMSGAAIAIRPVAGAMMDRSGRRRVILLGGALHIVACLVYLGVDELGPLVLVARVLQGIAEGALFSSLFTYAADIVPASRRTEGMGLFGVSGMLPISLAGLLGDFVLDYADYHTLFLVTVALATLAFLASLPLDEPPREELVEESPKGFWGALTQVDLLPLFFVGTAFAGAMAGIFTFLKTFLLESSLGTLGLFFSCYAASAIVLRIVFGWVPDRFGPKRVLYPSLMCTSVALASLGVAQGPWALGISGIFAGLGHGFAFPILASLVVERANAADRGSAMALFTAVFDAGILAGGPLLGLIVGALGYRGMYLVAALVPLLGAGIFAFWDGRVLRTKATESMGSQT